MFKQTSKRKTLEMVKVIPNDVYQQQVLPKLPQNAVPSS